MTAIDPQRTFAKSMLQRQLFGGNSRSASEVAVNCSAKALVDSESEERRLWEDLTAAAPTLRFNDSFCCPFSFGNQLDMQALAEVVPDLK